MPICGIEKLYVAVLQSDTPLGLIFNAPQYFKDIQELDIKPKVNKASAYAENRLKAQKTAFDSADISVNRYEMTSAERALILGQILAETGGVIASSNDAPPFVALLYKAPLEVGYRYGVIYKTLFTPPDDTMKGLEGKPDLSQTPKISGVAQPTDWFFKDAAGNEKHPWEYHVDTTDPNCPTDIDNTWFSAVPVPGADLTIPTVTTTPANGATGVAAASNVVFTFSKPIAINTVNDSNIMLLKADGSVVATTLSLSSDNKVVTLHPNANLAAGTYTAICSKSVTSISGIALAANKVITFTV